MIFALARTLFWDFAIQAVAAVISIALRTEKFYDLSGGLTFLAVVYVSYTSQAKPTFFHSIQSLCVCLWAVRLSGFLFVRALRFGDQRFKKVKEHPARFLLFFFVQAVWVFLTSMPTLLCNVSNRPSLEFHTGLPQLLGWGIFLFGFLFEAIADFQKYTFKCNPENESKFISSGLWSLSQHPNYFGEITLWTGLYISAAFVPGGHPLLFLISPLFVTFLLLKVSGIPTLSRSEKKRSADSVAHKKYIENTALLIPFVW
eukprot:m.41778 g.41778  ORF g.41778 m.41778 type:complete len:258 (-) comp14265_c0_seq1:24-797(-)